MAETLTREARRAELVRDARDLLGDLATSLSDVAAAANASDRGRRAHFFYDDCRRILKLAAQLKDV